MLSRNVRASVPMFADTSQSNKENAVNSTSVLQPTMQGQGDEGLNHALALSKRNRED